MLNRLMTPVSALACLVMLAGSASAESVNVGMLACDVSKGIGHFLTEKQKMSCEFRPVSGPAEQYYGKISDFGIELGKIKQGHLVWAVLVAALQDLPPGALAGKYIGVDADASLGVGLGANALIGGTGNGFILQPLSVEGEIGTNIAVGVRSVSLEALD
jgi:hypothetical protein